jgi:hypothetical protein
MPIKKYSIPSSTTTTTTSSSTTTTTTLNECTNIIFESFKGSYITSSNYFSIRNLLLSIFESGVIQLNCNLCCPVCSNFYHFSAFETYAILIGAAQELEELDCCTNIKHVQSTSIGCPSTDFTNCLDDLKDIIGQTNFDDLVSRGIIEIGTIAGNKTMICKFLQELQNSPVYSPTVVYYFFYALLEIGITVVCLNNGMISLSTTETFLKLIEAVGTNSFLN